MRPYIAMRPYIYCVIPDHVHVVVTIGEADLIAIMRDFKSYTTHIWRRQTGKSRLWQESFHDHRIRQSERMDELVRYVLENPVKAEMAADWWDKLWLGGSLIGEGT